MKHIIIGVGLLILQILLTFLLEFHLTISGKPIFNKYVNPVMLFIVSAFIPVYLFRIHLKNNSKIIAGTIKRTWIAVLWAAGGFGTILLAYKELQKVFIKFNEPEKWSDIIPQARTLYERFSNGEFPYAAIAFPGYDLWPVYMPMHWLPIGFADGLNIDIRWIGYIFYALAVSIYGWFLANQPISFLVRLIALVLPSFPLWGFILWGNVDLTVSYEIVIGAYYLLLAAALLSRKLWLVIVAIILCLLSRYTLLFWLPFFALILFLEKGWKKSLFVWGIVIASFTVIYIIPFYSKDPDVLKKALSHYTGATVGEWEGYGDPPVSYSLDRGISFAPHMKALFSGDMRAKVNTARVVQVLSLAFIFIVCVFAYRRWRNKIDLYSFGLISLYLFMLMYFFFAPLTYRYYLFPFLAVSAVLCANIVLLSKSSTEKSDSG